LICQTAGEKIGKCLDHDLGIQNVRRHVQRVGLIASTRDVQRCTQTPAQGRPEYWDVSYDFRGVEHHVQTTTPPGPTLTVNEAGEPRL